MVKSGKAQNEHIMKAVLHDWDDRASIEILEILRSCRRAMSHSATLIVIERAVGPPNELPGGKFSDINMMIQYGALERTRQEFHDLLTNGGFRMTEGCSNPVAYEHHRGQTDSGLVSSFST